MTVKGTHTLKRLLLPISIGDEVKSVEFFLCGVVPPVLCLKGLLSWVIKSIYFL